MDYGYLEDDMGSISPEALKAGLASGIKAGKNTGIGSLNTGIGSIPGGKAKKVKPDPRDANIFTADKGIQPPSPDEGPTKGKKKGGCVKMAKGGSASARADGCAQRGKTKGRMV